MLSDILIFNVTNNEFRKVADGGDFKFYSKNNQIAMVGTKVIALVDDLSDHNLNLIEWSLG